MIKIKTLSKKTISLVLSCIMAFSTCASAITTVSATESTSNVAGVSIPEVPNTLEALNKEKPETDENYDQIFNIEENSVNITQDGVYLVYGNKNETGNNISTSENIKAYITIRDVKIRSGQAIYLGNNSQVEINIDGNNSLSSYSNSNAGISIPEGGYLTISSESENNTLTVTGENQGAAGIGSNNHDISNPGDVYITGGSIEAHGNWGAAIGASQSGNINNIVITGGNINAQSSPYRAAGIGGGDFSSVIGGIYITGGKIYAYANENGAGIGGGAGYGRHSTVGVIYISGGEIETIGNSGGAGIGSGSNDNNVDLVIITGGTINASSRYNSGIGGRVNSVYILGGDFPSVSSVNGMSNLIVKSGMNTFNNNLQKTLSFVNSDNDNPVLNNSPVDFLFNNSIDVLKCIPDYEKNNDYRYFYNINGAVYEDYQLRITDSIMLADSTTISISKETKTGNYIVFNPNNNDDSFIQPVELGNAAIEPETPTLFKHRFLGWFDENGNEWDFSSIIDCDKTLTGRWEESYENISNSLPNTLRSLNKSKPQNDSGYDQSWNIEENSINITQDGVYLIYGYKNQTSNCITVADGITAYITLRNVNVRSNQAVYLGNNAQVEIDIDGNNSLSSYSNSNAGISIPEGGYLTISSESENNTLIATGENQGAAGIGSNNHDISNPGDVYITGGSIEAHGNWGAAIGASQSGNINNIVITGGNINAQSSPYRAAGIGGGDYSSVTGGIYITGGKIYAYANENGAGIGGGAGYGRHSTVGEIYISGGEIETIGNNQGSGIGSGSNDNNVDLITIAGGTINARGSNNAGIGGRVNNVNILGSNITASGTYAISSQNSITTKDSSMNVWGSSAAISYGTELNIENSEIKAYSGSNTVINNINNINVEGQNLNIFNLNFQANKNTVFNLIDRDNLSLKKLDLADINNFSSFALSFPDNSSFNLLNETNKFYVGDNNGETRDFSGGSYSNVHVSNEQLETNITFDVVDESKAIFTGDTSSITVSGSQKLSDIIPEYKLLDKTLRECFILETDSVTKTVYGIENIDEYSPVVDMTIKLATYTPETARVKYVYNNGEPDKYDYSNIINEPINKPTDPKKQYYEFLGWLDEDGVEWDFSNILDRDSITLSANWRFNLDYLYFPDVPDTLSELDKTKPQNDSGYDQSWNIEENSINITQDGVYLVYGYNNQTSNYLSVANGIKAYITIRNINISSDVSIGSGSHVTLNVEGSDIARNIITPMNSGYCVITADDKEQSLRVNENVYVPNQQATSDGNIYIVNSNMYIAGSLGECQNIGDIYVKDSILDVNKIINKKCNSEGRTYFENSTISNRGLVGASQDKSGDLIFKDCILNLSSYCGSYDNSSIDYMIFIGTEINYSAGNGHGIGAQNYGHIEKLYFDDCDFNMATGGDSIGAGWDSSVDSLEINNSTGFISGVNAWWRGSVGSISLDNNDLSMNHMDSYGSGGSFGDIDISNTTLTLSGGSIGGSSLVGNITITDSEIIGENTDALIAFRNRNSALNIGDITIINSKLSGESTGGITLFGQATSNPPNITLNNSEIDFDGNNSTTRAVINTYEGHHTVGAGGHIGDILISDSKINAVNMYDGICAEGSNVGSGVIDSITIEDSEVYIEAARYGISANKIGDVAFENNTIDMYSGFETIAINNSKNENYYGDLIILPDNDIRLFSKVGSVISRNSLDNSSDDVIEMFQGTFKNAFSDDVNVEFDNAISEKPLLLKKGYISFATIATPDTWNYVKTDLNDYDYFKGFRTNPDPNNRYTINYYVNPGEITKYTDLQIADYCVVWFIPDEHSTFEPTEIRVLEMSQLPDLPEFTTDRGYQFDHLLYEYYTNVGFGFGNIHNGEIYDYDELSDWYFEIGDKSLYSPETERITVTDIELMPIDASVWDNLSSMFGSFGSIYGNKYKFFLHTSPATYPYTVRYVNEEGEDIAPQKSAEAQYLSNVTETAITIPGYRPFVREQSITMNYENNEIVFVYEEQEETGRQLTVVVLEKDTYLGVKARVEINDTNNIELSDDLRTDDNGYVLTPNNYSIGDRLLINVSDLGEQYLPVSTVEYIVESVDDVIYIYVDKNDTFIITGYENKSLMIPIVSIVLFGIGTTLLIFCKKKKKK